MTDLSGLITFDENVSLAGLIVSRLFHAQELSMRKISRRRSRLPAFIFRYRYRYFPKIKSSVSVEDRSMLCMPGDRIIFNFQNRYRIFKMIARFRNSFGSIIFGVG